MRVFISATIDLKKNIPYQHTMPYLMEFLNCHHLSPGRMMFCFQDVPDHADTAITKTSAGKMMKAYPKIAEYQRP